MMPCHPNVAIPRAILKPMVWEDKMACPAPYSLLSVSASLKIKGLAKGAMKKWTKQKATALRYSLLITITITDGTIIRIGLAIGITANIPDIKAARVENRSPKMEKDKKVNNELQTKSLNEVKNTTLMLASIEFLNDFCGSILMNNELKKSSGDSFLNTRKLITLNEKAAWVKKPIPDVNIPKKEEAKLLSVFRILEDPSDPINSLPAFKIVVWI